MDHYSKEGTKTARKSTGFMAPRKSLANKAARKTAPLWNPKKKIKKNKRDKKKLESDEDKD